MTGPILGYRIHLPNGLTVWTPDSEQAKLAKDRGDRVDGVAKDPDDIHFRSAAQGGELHNSPRSNHA